jgi:F-type H+-transporting ATPase subunit b
VEGLGINLTLLVAQIFNFFILFLILSAVAYKPMVKFLDGRREKIAKGLEDARRAEERLANIEKDYQSRMDAAAPTRRRWWLR